MPAAVQAFGEPSAASMRAPAILPDGAAGRCSVEHAGARLMLYLDDAFGWPAPMQTGRHGGAPFVLRRYQRGNNAL